MKKLNVFQKKASIKLKKISIFPDDKTPKTERYLNFNYFAK